MEISKAANYLKKRKVQTIISLLLLSLFFQISIAIASHFRYGHISWKPRPDISPTAVEFAITVAYRRTAFSGSGGDGFAIIGDIFTPTALYFGDGTFISGVTFVVTSFDSLEDWIVGLAVDTTASDSLIIYEYTTADNGGVPWVAYISSCCRISGLQNSGGSSFRVSTLVETVTGNSSPVSSLIPIVRLAQGGTRNFNIPASDSDPNTILSWKLSDLTESLISSQPPLSVNGTTGEVTMNTTSMNIGDLWAVQVTIEDSIPGQFLTRVAVDFIISISDTTIDTNPPVFTSPTPTCNSTLFGSVGANLSFSVQAEDDIGDRVSLNSGGLPLGATMTPSLPFIGNPVSSDFSWTPSVTQTGSFVLNYSAADTTGNQSLCGILLSISDSSTIKVRIPDTYSFSLDTSSFPIILDSSGVPGIYSVEFRISFDSSIVTPIGLSKIGTVVGNAGWLTADTVKSGYITAAMAGNNALGIGDTLINVVYRIKDGITPGSVSFANFESFIFNEGTPLSSTKDGFITVSSIYGDVSEDGAVHAFDASLILAYLANDTAVLNDTIGDTTLSETRKVVADVSGNDTIATYDAHLILEYVATIRDCFPVECPESSLLAFGNLTLNDMVVPVVGDPFIYPVEIDGGSNIVSFEMEFEYDEDYLQFMNDITLTQLTQGFMINFNHEPGKVKLFGASESSDGSDGDFVFLSFVLIQDSAMIRLSRLVWNENDPETDVDIGIIRAVTGVEETGNNIPKEFALNQNYPNPFNPVTTIQYALPKRSDVTLTIYNLLGKEVERISELNKQAGYHEYVWDASHIATGVYFYRLRAGDFVQTRKMVLLK